MDARFKTRDLSLSAVQQAKPTVLSLPKAGRTEDEYEDACAIDVAGGVYAVADGASDSVFAKVWAQLLARRFVDALPAEGNPAGWQAWVRPAQDEWQATVHAHPLPWYVESKMREGAFATCLALIVRPGDAPDSPGHWAALAVGDTCLFHVQAAGPEPEGVESAAARGFPLTRPEQFTNSPLAVCSKPSGNDRVWIDVPLAVGTWHAGDSFILATDALAEWIVREIVPARAWDRLLGLAGPAGPATFRRLVDEQRGCGHMRNDDVTLVIVRPQPAPGATEGDNADVALPGSL